MEAWINPLLALLAALGPLVAMVVNNRFNHRQTRERHEHERLLAAQRAAQDHLRRMLERIEKALRIVVQIRDEGSRTTNFVTEVADMRPVEFNETYRATLQAQHTMEAIVSAWFPDLVEFADALAGALNRSWGEQQSLLSQRNEPPAAAGPGSPGAQARTRQRVLQTEHDVSDAADKLSGELRRRAERLSRVIAGTPPWGDGRSAAGS